MAVHWTGGRGRYAWCHFYIGAIRLWALKGEVVPERCFEMIIGHVNSHDMVGMNGIGDLSCHSGQVAGGRGMMEMELW